MGESCLPDCLLQVSDEILSQVEEFKYLGILFTSNVTEECQLDGRTGAMNLFVAMKSEPSLS